ncbi:hypothetical protein T484DRAFT_3155259 [Baffinella frigidus]|nr:hypothetical protein T484DRAFT_3155259 [Cryptophyta sp. CCMP2293]
MLDFLVPDISSLTYCNADSSCPGVYENALNHLDGTAHTWPAPVMVDPNVMDAPYSSYAAVPTEGTSSLVYCNADGSCPGVYENALSHLDGTAHTWPAPVMVDPNVMDAPYSSYAAMPEGTSSLVYCNVDGSCPGVYENALSHLDGTAHTWPAPVMVDPNVMDAPYSSYAAVPTEGTSSLVYCNADGSCPGVYENALDHLDTTAHEWSAPAAGPDSWANGGAVETASSKLSLFYEGPSRSSRASLHPPPAPRTPRATHTLPSEGFRGIGGRASLSARGGSVVTEAYEISGVVVQCSPPRSAHRALPHHQGVALISLILCAPTAPPPARAQCYLRPPCMCCAPRTVTRPLPPTGTCNPDTDDPCTVCLAGTCNPMPGWTPTWNPPETGCANPKN